VHAHRLRQLLVLCALVLGFALVGVGSASADVSCADLSTRDAAQSYLEANPADLDHLDSDGDGRACEANDPHTYGRWSLPGLAVLVLGGLAVNAVVARRQARTRVEEPARVLVPAQRAADPSTVSIVAAPDRDHPLPSGSLDELARTLRRVPGDKRMSLVELYAVAHHAAPHEVLDALGEVSDVGIQRWALARRHDRSDHPSS
jgi:hypothetical protein